MLLPNPNHVADGLMGQRTPSPPAGPVRQGSESERAHDGWASLRLLRPATVDESDAGRGRRVAVRTEEAALLRRDRRAARPSGKKMRTGR